jgi:hypothetical protein
VALAEEVVAAARREGGAFTKRENVHKMAEANKASRTSPGSGSERAAQGGRLRRGRPLVFRVGASCAGDWPPAMSKKPAGKKPDLSKIRNRSSRTSTRARRPSPSASCSPAKSTEGRGPRGRGPHGLDGRRARARHHHHAPPRRRSPGATIK